MRRIVQAALIEAFHTDAKVAAIARRNGISERTVRHFWATAKKSGRLPAVRPEFAVCVLGADDDEDADNSVTPDRNREASGAALAALQREHGADVIRKFDNVPPAVLRDEHNGHPPTARRLLEFFKTKDVLVRAVMHARQRARGN